MNIISDIEGEIAGNAYFIKYDENLWMQLPAERQEQCKKRWTELAEPLEVSEVVLQLIPDALFPVYGKENPYITWRHKFSKSDNAEWETKVTVLVTMSSDPVALSERDIDKFKQLWTKYPKGTRFCLNSLQGKPMMEHTT